MSLISNHPPFRVFYVFARTLPINGKDVARPGTLVAREPITRPTDDRIPYVITIVRAENRLCKTLARIPVIEMIHYRDHTHTPTPTHTQTEYIQLWYNRAL